MNAADLHDLLVVQRLALCDIVENFTDEQFAAPSLCTGWAVRDVLSHLLGPIEFSAIKALSPLVRSRFNFNAFTQRLVAQDPRAPSELVTALRKGARGRWTPPGFGFEAPLTDIAVHTGDICIPLNVHYPVDLHAARAVLDFLITKKARRGFTSTEHTTGIRFEATDLNWAFGTGPVVAGPSQILMQIMTGRTATLTHAHGDGVAVLQSRTSS